MIVLDVETGGLDPNKHALCSITLKVLNEDAIKTIFIKPELSMNYTAEAMDINGLTLKQLHEIGIEPKEAVSEIKNFITENFGNNKPSIVGHNVRFDLGFIESFFLRHDEQSFSDIVEPQAICTMYNAQKIHRSGIKRHSRFKLGIVYRELFGEDFEDAHTSEADVLATERVFNKQRELILAAEDQR